MTEHGSVAGNAGGGSYLGKPFLQAILAAGRVNYVLKK
jgi:hypothetical protein